MTTSTQYMLKCLAYLLRKYSITKFRRSSAKIGLIADKLTQVEGALKLFYRLLNENSKVKGKSNISSSLM